MAKKSEKSGSGNVKTVSVCIDGCQCCWRRIRSRTRSRKRIEKLSNFLCEILSLLTGDIITKSIKNSSWNQKLEIEIRKNEIQAMDLYFVTIVQSYTNGKQTSHLAVDYLTIDKVLTFEQVPNSMNSMVVGTTWLEITS